MLGTCRRKRPSAVGIEGRVSGHSLRVGDAQSLAAGGASIVEMQTAGRWQHGAPSLASATVADKAGVDVVDDYQPHRERPHHHLPRRRGVILHVGVTLLDFCLGWHVAPAGRKRVGERRHEGADV